MALYNIYDFFKDFFIKYLLVVYHKLFWLTHISFTIFEKYQFSIILFCATPCSMRTWMLHIILKEQILLYIKHFISLSFVTYAKLLYTQIAFISVLKHMQRFCFNSNLCLYNRIHMYLYFLCKENRLQFHCNYRCIDRFYLR